MGIMDNGYNNHARCSEICFIFASYFNHYFTKRSPAGDVRLDGNQDSDMSFSPLNTKTTLLEQNHINRGSILKS